MLNPRGPISIFLFGLLINSPSSFGHAGPCEDALIGPTSPVDFADQVMTPWKTFRSGLINNYMGFVMRRESPKGLETLEYAMPDMETKPLIRGTTLKSPDGYYTLVESGFRRLKRISEEINRLAYEHLTLHPLNNLRVQFSPRLSEYIRVLSNYRWQVHDAVLEKYSREKPYLNERDFFLPKWSNTWSGNSDVYSLLKGSNFSPHEAMPDAEFKDRLLLTIQVSYFGDRNYFKPTARGIMKPLGLGAFTQTFDYLPFEYRLMPGMRDAVRKVIKKRFDLKTSCEVVRYAKFSKVPLSVQNKFLLKAFETAKFKGVKTFFAVGDRDTMRLFRRYGFTPLVALPVGEKGDELEYLTYLETDSDQFIQLLAKLRTSSATTEEL